MQHPIPQPETINKLRAAVDSGFAMLAGMQLGVFTPLKAGPMTVEQLAAAIGVGPSRLRPLLFCLVVAGLLTERNGQFSNTPEADHFLVKGELSYIGDRHSAIATRWTTLSKTAESIRSGKPMAKLDFSNSPRDELERFLRNINPRTVLAARSLLDFVDFSSVSTVVDVGCGGAGLAITLAKACPHITATGIDLAQVAPIAQKIIAEAGLTERVKVIAADVVSSSISGAYDVAVLRGFLQVLSADNARAAIRNIAKALNADGKIYIIGQVLDDSRTSPVEAVGFNLLFLNTFDEGESYTESQYRGWLTEAGLVNIQRANVLLDDGSSLITAQKPQ
jgi:SAM-dependent methyltransferase